MREAEPFEGWAIVELMGHRRLAGRVSQAEMFGTALLRIDVPGPGSAEADEWTTQLYGGQAIYCLTPTTEAVARAVARRSRPEPIHPFELPAPSEPEPSRRFCQECGARGHDTEDCLEDSEAEETEGGG